MIKRTLNTIPNYSKVFRMSKELKKLVAYNTSLSVVYSIVRQIGAFTLSLATMFFENNFVLSLVFLALYILREPFFTIINTKLNQNDAFFELKVEEFLASIKGKVLAKTRDKVEIEQDGRRQKMSATVILDTVKEYITRKNKTLVMLLVFIFDTVIFFFSIFFLIKVAMDKTTNFILFISVLIVSSITMTFVSVFISKARENLWKTSKSKFDNMRNAERDVQEIEPISFRHINFLLANVVKAQKEITDLNLNDRKRKNIGDVIKSVIIAISLISVVFIMMFAAGNITATVFMASIAFGQAFSSVISSISTEVNLMYEIINNRKENKAKYEEDFNSIMKVYLKEEKISYKNFSEDTLVIEPFSYTYPTTGFNLTQNKKFTLKRGEVVLLDGKSGTGKSTFIKIISGENELPGTKYRLKSIKYFNDTSKFGSKDLLEEITLGCYDEAKDKKKLNEILNGTMLSSKYATIEELTKISAKELSNGLMQRALLARTLYNLEDADLVCVDEPIGSLDEENAKKVIAFVKEYCNRDKTRFVILCTHQYKFVDKYIDSKVYIKSITPQRSEIIV